MRLYDLGFTELRVLSGVRLGLWSLWALCIFSAFRVPVSGDRTPWFSVRACGLSMTEGLRLGLRSTPKYDNGLGFRVLGLGFLGLGFKGV